MKETPLRCSVFFETHGCKVNMYETAVLQTLFRRHGITICDQVNQADYYVLNSCSVTAKADSEARNRLRSVKRQNPAIDTILTGCYASNIMQNSDQRAIADHICKSEPKEIIKLIDSTLNIDPEQFLFADDNSGKTRAYLKLQEGCKEFCTYCIIPYTRPTLKSVPVDLAVNEVSRLHQLGFNEVVLGGIHLGYYGQDLKEPTDFMAFIRALKKLPTHPRVRISSIEPRVVTSELIAAVSETPWLCNYFHIPLQSGDDTILRRMNRKYDSRFYRQTIHAIASKNPTACIGADVIVGFPGESVEQFENTVKLITELPVHYLHVFPYSDRPGPRSYRLPKQICKAEKKERSARLRILSEQKQLEFHKSNEGKTVQVIPEQLKSGIMFGRSDNYIPIYFECDDHALIGQPIDVTIIKAHTYKKTTGQLKTVPPQILRKPQLISIRP